MDGAVNQPELSFFCGIPDGMMSRPPLCSSLQNLESSFYLIALGRFPHALVMCASAVESAMKAILQIPAEKFVSAEKLFAMAIKGHATVGSFPDGDLERFRHARNRIVHFGFSPQDDEVSAGLLLETGFKFLSACYEDFFCFTLRKGMAQEVADQLWVAIDVYQRAKAMPGVRPADYFSVFGHAVRTGVRQSLMHDWENAAASRAEEIGVKFDHTEKRKSQLERAFGVPWAFDCPVCHDIEILVCELDGGCLEAASVSIMHGECASCGLVIPTCPLLADTVCSGQLLAGSKTILKGYGIRI